MRHIPFIHQLCSPSLYTKINFCIYTKLFRLFLSCGIYIVSWFNIHLLFTHALFRNHLLSGSARHFEIILSSLWLGIGTRYSETLTLKSTQIHRNMALTQSTFEFCDLTKGNGVDNALVTPYHPRSNSQEIFLDHCAKPCVKIIFFRLHQNVVLGLLISLLLLLLCS